MTTQSAGIGLARDRARHDTLASSPLPYGLLLLFVLMIYGTPALLLPQLEALRPAMVVGATALAAILTDRLLSKRGLLSPCPQGYALLAFAGVALLSCFSALWMRFAFERCVDLARYLIIYFAIVNTVDSRRRLEGLIAIMALGGLIPALGALTTKFEPGTQLGWVGIFENYNDFAFAMVILVPLAVALASRPGWLWHLMGWTMAALFVVTIFATGSRGALLGLVAALSVSALRAQRSSTRVLFAAGLVGTFLFVALFWTRQQGFSDLANDVTVIQRVQSIQAGVAMWIDRPALGVGLGNSALGWPLYAPPGAWSPNWLHSHNTILQVLSETGTLGFLTYTAVLLTTLAYLLRVRRTALALDDHRLLTIASSLEAATWGFLVCSISGGYLLSWFPYLLFALAATANALPEVRAHARGESPAETSPAERDAAERRG